MDVARRDGVDAGDAALQPGEERRGAKPRQRVAAFEAGEMLGLGRHTKALGGVRKAGFVTPLGSGATPVETRDSRAPMR